MADIVFTRASLSQFNKMCIFPAFRDSRSAEPVEVLCKSMKKGRFHTSDAGFSFIPVFQTVFPMTPGGPRGGPPPKTRSRNESKVKERWVWGGGSSSNGTVWEAGVAQGYETPPYVMWAPPCFTGSLFGAGSKKKQCKL